MRFRVTCSGAANWALSFLCVPFHDPLEPYPRALELFSLPRMFPCWQVICPAPFAFPMMPDKLDRPWPILRS
jgi:hypothetical protein